MLHIQRKKITNYILIIVSLFFITDIVAQREASYNFDRNFKSKPYYFGIGLGYANNDYRIQQSESFILNNRFAKIETVGGPSFNIGIIGNLKIGDSFDFRFIPGFSFASRDIVFSYLEPQPNEATLQIEQIQSVFMEMPFAVRYKSRPYKDMRIFVLGGFKYTYDISNTSRRRDEDNLLRISPHDYLVEAGVGFQFFFPYFIFSPEIKFSHGLDNIHVYDRNSVNSSVIEKILSRTFTITLHFEG